MPGLITRMWGYVFFGRFALKRYRGLRKLRVLFTYTRVKLKSFFLAGIFKMKAEKFLGYKIVFDDYRHFVFMFEQIFLAFVYYFEVKNKKPVIYDCGANIGLATIFFKYLYPGATITAFEPDPVVFEMLKKNIEMNRFKGVTAVNRAVFDRVKR